MLGVVNQILCATKMKAYRIPGGGGRGRLDTCDDFMYKMPVRVNLLYYYNTVILVW